MLLSDSAYETEPVGCVTCEDGEIDIAKSPTLNGMGTCTVTEPSVNTAVGEYTPGGVLDAVLMVTGTTSTWPGGRGMGFMLNWHVAPLGSPWQEGCIWVE